MCISHFSNRRLGAKDPLPSRRRFVQSFLYLLLLYNGGTKSQGGATQFSRRCGKTPDGRTIGGFRLGFGKKRGRKEDSTEFERRRLTASATFLAFRILGGFEQPITELKTKFDKFVNSRAAGRRRRCVPGWSAFDTPLGTTVRQSSRYFRELPARRKAPLADQGWCSAQRIKIEMIASGNHTIICAAPVRTLGLRGSEPPTFLGTLNKAWFYNPSVSRLRETRETAPFTQGSRGCSRTRAFWIVHLSAAMLTSSSSPA